MRIHKDNLAAFISETIINVRNGVKLANDEGISAELPAFIDFTGIEVIHARLANTKTTETTDAGETTVAGTSAETRAATESGTANATDNGTTATQRNSTDVSPQIAVVTTQAASTETDSGNTTTNGGQSENGQDEELIDVTYQEWV